MLRKIYQELVEIRKELHAIHAIQKSMESRKENLSCTLDEKVVPNYMRYSGPGKA